MRAILFAAFFFTASYACAGTWTRVDRSTLKLQGELEWGEYEKFAAAFDGDVKELVVTSNGGSAEDGVKIGLALAAQNVKVVVVDHCLSSCANYLFVGGHERELRRGIVGFHGNITGCDNPAQREKDAEDMRRQGADEKTIQETFAREALAEKEEARFLQIMGVDQALFNRTCTVDKGMGDGKSYVFLLPTRRTFEKYRLYGVVGEQDPAVIKALPYPVVVD